MDKIRIIIADDHKLFRKGLVALIEDLEIIEQIYEAADGLECLQIMEEANPKPELVLLDLKMPNLDGIDTTLELHNKFPGTKIIILSMQDDERFIIHMIEQGVNGYLLKNADPEEVEKAIYCVLENDYYFNQNIAKIIHKSFLKKDPASEDTIFDECGLTDREQEILKLICMEYTGKEIADTLNISIRTVEGHRKSLLKKTNVKNTAGLVVYALRNNIVKF